MVDVSKIQAEIAEWAKYNFGEAPDSINPLLGMIEEAGELCHAVLKSRQGIRGFNDPEKRRAAVKDACGDLMVFMCNFAIIEGFDLAECLEEVWAEVKQRDWRKNPAGV